MEGIEAMRKRLQKAQQEAEDLRTRCAEAKAQAEEIKGIRLNQEPLKDRVSKLTIALKQAQEDDRVAQENEEQILFLLGNMLQDIKKKRNENLAQLHASLNQKLVDASLLHKEASTILDHLEHT